VQEVVTLIEECLAQEPRKRPTAAQVLQRLLATATASGAGDGSSGGALEGQGTAAS
jgi:hypothetical protein